jgi:transposase-like protein
MISNVIEKVRCPKCGASDENIEYFKRDIYIVRDENDFVRRKLYGCKKCENMFTYDNTPRKESKNITTLQSAFSKLAKSCENVTSGVSIKH